MCSRHPASPSGEACRRPRSSSWPLAARPASASTALMRTAGLGSFFSASISASRVPMLDEGIVFSVSTALMRTPSCVSLRSTFASACAISGSAVAPSVYVCLTQSMAARAARRHLVLVLHHVRIRRTMLLSFGGASHGDVAA